jgi:iron complex outermembrane receptor protein
MPMMGFRGSLLLTAAAIVFGAGGASAQTQMFNFNFPQQSLAESLSGFAQASGQQIIFTQDVVDNLQAPALHGTYTVDAALSRILNGSHLVAERTPSGALMIERARPVTAPAGLTRTAEAAPARAAASVETVVVTSSKIKGDIQTVPIAITALSQEQLTSRQIAGGPDLVKEVPNLTFTKTNFTGYSIQIRGIGTQAISVATDPAVAVALNDIPFIRNHFFEQEFFDVGQVEVLRGPQGTLYGRNATAGVVNVISAKPTDQFEAMVSADWGNFVNRRYEGMVNIPIVDDRLDLRVAGEWTKRDGYTKNEITGSQVDGRDLWSTRATLQWKPSSSVQADLVWEHFQESDDRMRTSKQLCYSDNPTNHPAISNVLGVPVPVPGTSSLTDTGVTAAFTVTTGYLSQGCLPASLYSPKSFEVPYGYSLPVVVAGWVTDFLKVEDPYASTTQSTNLRNIQTEINPRYIAKNDTLELNVDYNITPALTFTSQTGYNNDFLWSTEDYNRFDTAPGIFLPPSLALQGINNPGPRMLSVVDNNGVFCDPQLGCSDRLVAQDISSEHAWQLSQEFRLASNFKGPFNFSVGGNYMHYETEEQYYVFANTLSLFAASVGVTNGSLGWNPGPWQPGVSDNHECFTHGGRGDAASGYGYQYNRPELGAGIPTEVCYYIDPNPLTNLNAKGHNYFLSQNPYLLDSYAAFGETYYNVLPDLKLTGGIRWTDDKKHFIDIPSELIANGYGYAATGTVNQQWNQLTGRLAANWTPKLDFTDQTLVYGSFAHGYKAGGANPPGAVLFAYGDVRENGVPVHPLTFKPEFIDAYELGTKNTLADGGLTLNGDIFFYNYKGYQISEIVDRTAINLNFDATVRGAELEASYEPIPGLKFNFAGGYEATRIDNGQSAVDLMDRTAGHPGWMLFKPFVTLPSNCIFPDYVVANLLLNGSIGAEGNNAVSACGTAYAEHWDPGTAYAAGGYYHWNNGNPYYTVSPSEFYPYDPGSPKHYYSSFNLAGYPGHYPGFDPLAGTPGDPYVGQNTYNGFDYGPVPNNGEGFSKNLGGNQLPNAPHFTVSLSGDYTLPVSEDWAATLHSDFYWQSQSFARVFNDRPYDKIRGYSNVNLALILTSASGWQVMGYLKNVFDTTAITGAFLNSDDSGLTTNVFLTDPRLFGVRVTKNW